MKNKTKKNLLLSAGWIFYIIAVIISFFSIDSCSVVNKIGIFTIGIATGIFLELFFSILSKVNFLDEGKNVLGRKSQ